MTQPARCGFLNWDHVARALALDISLSCSVPTDRWRDVMRFSRLVTSPLTLKIRDDYVNCVKAWRVLLCSGWSASRDLERLISFLDILEPIDGIRFRIRKNCGWIVAVVNRAMLIAWKCRFPSPTEDWSPFMRRVSRSGCPTLTPDQTSVLRNRLKAVEVPCDWSELRGRNGPGAVAGGEQGPYKWFFDAIPEAVPLDFFRLNVRHLIEDSVCHPFKYGVTRALQVPKDARGPRYISCEPLASQHSQFALKDALMKRVLKTFGRWINPYDTREHCRLLEDRAFCTIDLKDASDLVSRRLVWSVMPEHLRQKLFDVRSTFVQAAGKIVPLRTFAPMGSCLCFDVMQVIIACAIEQLTTARYYGFHVFGDDIIVHARAYNDTLAVLRDLGLKPNTLKCCGPASRFRESCGEEWYWEDGFRINIRPVYLRDLTGGLKAMVSAALASQKLRAAGLATTATAIDEDLTAAGLRWPHKFRYNSGLQRLEVLTYKVRAITETEELDEYPGLYRWFSARAEDHDVDLHRPRTRVSTSYFDVEDEGIVRPRVYPESVRCFQPEGTINGKPLKAPIDRYSSPVSVCDPSRSTLETVGGPLAD